MLNKKKTNKLTETNQCESCQQFGKGTCNAFKCIARNYCDWEEIMKPKELDWRDKIDWVDDWLEIDCQVIFGEKGKKTLIKFIEYLLTQQRSELLEEIKTRIDTWGGFEDDGGNLCHYDSEILEWVNDLLNKKDE